MTDRRTHDRRARSREQTASTALVPAAGPDQAGPERTPPGSFAITRHDPSFVTQLIATAAQVPQTRVYRRASPADAQSSYRAALDNGHPLPLSRPLGTSRVA